MRFQQFHRTSCAHLGRNHAHDILFQRNVVDNCQSATTTDDSQRATKYLALLPLPMKPDTDRDIIERERCISGVYGRQCNVGSEAMTPTGIRFTSGICEGANQFHFDSRPSFHQSHRNVHSFSATSLNMASGSVTSL